MTDTVAERRAAFHKALETIARQRREAGIGVLSAAAIAFERAKANAPKGNLS